MTHIRWIWVCLDRQKGNEQMRLSWACFPSVYQSQLNIFAQKTPFMDIPVQNSSGHCSINTDEDEHSGDYTICSIKSISVMPNDRKWSIWCSIKTVLVRRIRRRSEPLGASGLH